MLNLITGMCVYMYVCVLYDCMYVPYISELKQGTNRSLVSFTSLVISSDNVNRGLVLFALEILQ